MTDAAQGLVLAPASLRRHPPGDLAIWVFILAELAAFGVAFVSSYTELVTSPSAKRVVSQPLSEQEIACLAWALDGKTDRDIAELIEKSYATVRFYMERAAGKLGTVNRVQTVAKAAMLGYISPREFAPH